MNGGPTMRNRMQGETRDRAKGIEERLAASRERFLAYVRRRIADPELAEDLVQESLLRAVRAAPELRDEERLLPWFYRILRHAIVDAYRLQGRERKFRAAAEAEDAPEAPEEEAIVCACFERLVLALKPEYAELIRALDLGGETPSAVARRLAITPNNLKVRHHRARRALRKRLEETCRACAERHCLDCTCRPASKGVTDQAVLRL